jgi:hypothetical protein
VEFTDVLTTPNEVTVLTHNGESISVSPNMARSLSSVLKRKADMAEIITWDDPIDAEKVDPSKPIPVAPDEIIATIARFFRKLRYHIFDILSSYDGE